MIKLPIYGKRIVTGTFKESFVILLLLSENDVATYIKRLVMCGEIERATTPPLAIIAPTTIIGINYWFQFKALS